MPATEATGQSVELDRLMSALAQRKHGHVAFVEQKFIALLERPVESSGELLYDAPDRLEKRTVKPRPESLVLEGGVVTARRGRHTYVLDLHRYPQIMPFIESMRATLAGDRPALERVFQLDFAGTLASWTLGLAPRDPELAGTVREIRIAGDHDQVRTVEIREADGDRSLLTIGAELAP
ncbi:MAG TPA: LolA-related protein [Steroidobacteraceae bacterium]|nr:LolA-related protein [Steroidobacteraceae bacterium]